MSGAARAWALVGVVALACALRLGAASAWDGERPDDPDNYGPLARSLASGRGLSRADGQPTAYRPPLYPLVLVPWVLLPERSQPWALALLHAGLGAATVVLTWSTAKSWGLGDRRALVAAFLVAADPVLVARSGAVMTETLTALLLAGGLAAMRDGGAFERRQAIRAGLWWGLAALCRPSALAIAAAVGLAALARAPGGTATRLGRVGWMTLTVVVVLAPWAVRNTLVLGEPVWTTTHGGYTLALANNPAYYADVMRGPAASVWSGPNQRAWFVKISEETAGMTEPQADRFLRREAWRMVWERPGDFARASLGRLGRFWGVAPSRAVYGRAVRWGTAAWTVPFWLAALVGLASRRARSWPAVAAVASVLALSLVHVFYWTDMRMRAPIVPALALTAVLAGTNQLDRARAPARPDGP